MFIYAFSDGLSKAMPFLVFPIIAYYLSKEEFGLITNYSVLISIIGPFIGLASTSYFGVNYYNDKQGIPKLYINLLYFNTLLFLLVSLILYFVIDYVQQWTKLSTVFIVFALLSAMFGIFSDLFLTKVRMEENVRFFGIINFVLSATTVLFTVLFIVVLKYGWQGRILSLFLTSIVSVLIAVYFIKDFLKPLKKPDFKIIKSALLFGLPLLPHNLSLWIKTGFEKIIITSKLGLAQNGEYSFALTICSVFVMFSGAFFSAFSPYVFKTLSEFKNITALDLENNKRAIVKKSYYFLIIYLIILIAGGVIASVGIELFFSKKYGNSIIYIPFLLGYNFFNSCYIILSIFIYFSRTTKYLGIITILTSFLQVLTTVTFVKIYGTLGAAISSLIISIITMIGIFIYSNKVYPMPWLSFRKLDVNSIN